jgi:hypothetical protein
MTRGRCGSLLLHRNGLAPSTLCRSPGAPHCRPSRRQSGAAESAGERTSGDVGGRSGARQKGCQRYDRAPQVRRHRYEMDRLRAPANGAADSADGPYVEAVGPGVRQRVSPGPSAARFGRSCRSTSAGQGIDAASHLTRPKVKRSRILFHLAKFSLDEVNHFLS